MKVSGYKQYNIQMHINILKIPNLKVEFQNCQILALMGIQ